MIRHTTKLLAAAALTLAAPAAASAAVELSAEQVRSYDLPDGFALQDAQIQSTRDGLTMLSATTGDAMPVEGEEFTPFGCTVVVADSSEATEYTYRYQGNPTGCVGVLPHPDGGFFLRGAEGDAEEGDVVGFTTYIDAAGNEQWLVHDQRLVDALPEPDGPGEFLGQYVQPHPEMAYSEQFDKLMAFTTGKLNIGGGQPLTQAHVINAGSGTLKVSGQTFGLSGSAGFIAETATRASDGYYLLYIYSAGSQGAYFFSFNGRNRIDTFAPLGEDWSQRYIRRMVYGPDENVHLLWTPTNEPGAPTNVTVVDGEANEVWSGSYEASDGDIELGAPRGMWVGANYTMVLYGGGGSLQLRVIDVATGEELGLAPLDGLTEFQPVAILNGDQGRLKLLATNGEATQVHEFALEVSATAGGGDAGGDAGFGDAGPGGSGGGDEGCAAAGMGNSTPVSAALAGIGALLLGFGWRRRRA